METPYIRINVAVGNESITIAKDSVYRLVAGGLSGVEASDVSPIISDHAGADGGYAEGVKIPPRPITLTFAVSDKKQTESRRRRLIRMFSPKLPVTLTVERGGRRRKITGYLAEQPTFTQPNIRLDRLTVYIKLTCPDPYFTDVEPTTVRFMKSDPLLTFPFNSIAGVGVSSGIRVISDTATLENDGDIECGIVCDITARGGRVTNPRISLDGKFVRALTVLEDGDKLQIDTRRRNKNIYINGESAFIFDRKSIFFSIPPGTSTVTVSADSGIKDAAASFTYSCRYLGV